MAFAELVQYVLHGVSLGGMYALVAVGYTIIYGVVGLINQAHSMLFTMAAFLAMWGVYRYNLPEWLSFVLATVITAVVGNLAEKVAYRPLRDYRISGFTAAIGVSMLLQHLLILLFTASAKAFPRPSFMEGVVHLGSVMFPVVSIIVIIACVAMFLILSYVVMRTKIGRAMRALSRDTVATQLMGVDTDRVISFAFLLSTLYASAGAYLWCFRFPSVDPYIGVMPGLKAFVGAVIGGIGSIPGALVGAFLLGMAEMLLVGFFPTLTGWRDVFAYAILIVFLVVRPSGIFNVKTIEEKV